jgi:uncharacterized lipoprotein YddW (UPF0748 family)
MRRLLLCLLAWFLPAAARSQELRGFWVDAFHAGFKSPTEVSQLVADARAANCNALFVQVRKRGDAYYSNGLEPRATDISSASFDPLADLVAKASSGPEPLKIHAWIVSFNIWNSQSSLPSQPSHPYRTHPDWLTQRNDGVQWDGANYAFDPGHPAVQQHTFDVAMDILRRYNVDGLHLDYIRYTDANASIGSNPWGYNPVTVARFLRLNNRTTTPGPGDSTWLQFRRDQVSALVRKLCLHAWQLRPSITLSAATIAYGSAPTSNSPAAWRERDAYARVLQDWRSWLEEGILDLAIPMVYRDQTNATRASEWLAWTSWTRDNQFNRHAAAGLGNYLNRFEGTLTQIPAARTTNASGRSLSGAVLYSYGTWGRTQNPDSSYSSNYLPRATFLDALTNPSTAQSFGGTAPFPAPVTVPPMPWKSDPSRGHLMGFLRIVDGAIPIDGASITLTGPSQRTLKSDATGFFGAIDLPPGAYSLSVSIPGFPPISRSLTISGASVASANLWLDADPFAITAISRNPATRRTSLTWHSLPDTSYSVQFSDNLQSWSPASAPIPSQGPSTSWTSPPDDQTRRFYRVATIP